MGLYLWYRAVYVVSRQWALCNEPCLAGVSGLEYKLLHGRGRSGGERNREGEGPADERETESVCGGGGTCFHRR